MESSWAGAVQPMLADDARPLPAALLSELTEQIQTEWALGEQYGALMAQLGVWVEFPLVNLLPDGRVVVPVVEALRMPIRGRLELRAVPPARRIAVLLDVSESANSGTLLLRQSGALERVSVVEAGLRATQTLIAWLQHERSALGAARGRDADELAVIAFGESTEPLITPGSEIQQALERLRDPDLPWPPGGGRSDAVCALRLAHDWLTEAPAGALREIIMLTSADLPHSGRFTDCDAQPQRGKTWRQSCLAALEHDPCPASYSFAEGTGRSDVARLFAFARDAKREELAVSVLLLRPERPPRFFRELVNHTGGRLSPVLSLSDLDLALHEILNRETTEQPIEAVEARNLRTGDLNANLLDGDQLAFDGALPLLPGANDIEVRVRAGGKTAALLRFRVFSAPSLRDDFLEALRRENEQSAARHKRLDDEWQSLTRPRRTQELEITPETPPEP